MLAIFDRGLAGPHGPWERLARGLPAAGTSAVALPTKLHRLHAEPDSGQIVVVGTSRALRVHTATIANAFPERRVLSFARHLMDVFAIRSLVPDLAAARPGVVVWPLSEFDTHRPLRIEPLLDKTSADAAALAELYGAGIRLEGPGFAWRHRESALRVLAGAVSNTYRFRAALLQTPLGALHRLTRPATAPGSASRPSARARPVLGDASPERLPGPLLDALAARHGADFPRGAARMLPWIAEIQRGPHASVQQELLTRATEQLVGAGSRVLLLECPLHPVAADLAERGARGEFRRHARRLAKRPGVEFVSYADGDYPARSFRDPLHLDDEGAARLTDVAVRALRALLPAPGR